MSPFYEQGIKMKFSEEQDAVIRSSATRLRVRARAGSGKTSTLRGYAEYRPGERILCLVYNKGVQQEAEKVFPRNVKCSTAHSLAFRAVGVRYKHKLGNVRAIEVARAFDVPYLDAQAALDAVRSFMASPDHSIDFSHLGGTSERRAPAILEIATNVWAAMIDEAHDKLPLEHDGYLKLFQLSNPRLAFDRILLDEAQDTNPVTATIVTGQDCGKVYVGDEYQSIYGFRGAVNALETFPADQQLYLTHSFRYGPGIAKVATALLTSFLKATHPVYGLGEPTQFTVEADKPHAVLCRTNAGIFDQSVSAIRAGHRLYFVGGFENYQFEKVMDAFHLQSGQIGQVRDRMMRSFSSFFGMEEYAKKVKDKELLALIKVVHAYGQEIPSLTDKIRSASCQRPQDAFLTLATAHKGKGLEFPSVVLADDFPSLFDDETGRPLEVTDRETREEIHLYYVAVTRAKKAIQLNTELKRYLDYINFTYN